jgi:hypothetical protein
VTTQCKSYGDFQPEHAEARPVRRRGRPCCGACGRLLQHHDQHRCPWLACRAWLRGSIEDAERERQRGEQRDLALFDHRRFTR